VNQPPEEYVVVTEPELLRFSHDCFESAGLRGDHAQLISRLLVNSDLRGVRSHGTRQVDGYCAAFEEGELDLAVLGDLPTLAKLIRSRSAGSELKTAE